MAVDLKSILEMLEKIIDLEAKVEEGIKSEKDKARRAKIRKAFKDRDPAAMRDIIFDL